MKIIFDWLEKMIIPFHGMLDTNIWGRAQGKSASTADSFVTNIFVNGITCSIAND